MARGEFDFLIDPTNSLFKIEEALQGAGLYYTPMQDLFGNLRIQADMWGQPKISKISSMPVDQEHDLRTFLEGELQPGIYVSVGEGVDEDSPSGSTRLFDQEHQYIGYSRDSIANNTWSSRLADGSVQELFMGDALLSPIVPIAMIPPMLAQAKRVLNPETGRLVIGQSGFYTRPEKLVMLDALLKHAGFEERYFVNPEKAGKVGNAVGWPADILYRGMSTHFMMAKPHAERSASSRRRHLGRG